MKSVLQMLLIGIIGSIIAYYLCELVIPQFGTVVTKYPFEAFVVFTLTAIMILLTVLTVKFKGH